MEIPGDPYIILLKETQVSNNSKPDKHGGGSQENTTDIITCQTLYKKIEENKMLKPHRLLEVTPFVLACDLSLLQKSAKKRLVFLEILNLSFQCRPKPILFSRQSPNRLYRYREKTRKHLNKCSASHTHDFVDIAIMSNKCIFLTKQNRSLCRNQV